MHTDVSRLMQADQAIFDHIHDFVLRCGITPFRALSRSVNDAAPVLYKRPL
jgi:hypothetical protein